jgi:hypothetical protein
LPIQGLCAANAEAAQSSITPISIDFARSFHSSCKIVAAAAQKFVRL